MHQPNSQMPSINLSQNPLRMTKHVRMVENAEKCLISLLARQMGQMADGTFDALPLSEFGFSFRHSRVSSAWLSVSWSELFIGCVVRIKIHCLFVQASSLFLLYQAPHKQITQIVLTANFLTHAITISFHMKWIPLGVCFWEVEKCRIQNGCWKINVGCMCVCVQQIDSALAQTNVSVERFVWILIRINASRCRKACLTWNRCANVQYFLSHVPFGSPFSINRWVKLHSALEYSPKTMAQLQICCCDA